MLSAHNGGARRVRLADVRLLSPDGVTIAEQRGLVGYVLPRATMRWPIGPASADAPSQLSLTTDTGRSVSRSRGIDWVLLALALTISSPARSQDWTSLIKAGPATAPAGDLLLLEVVINDRSTDLIATVEQRAGGKLYIMADELEAVGLSPQTRTGLIRISDLIGVKARYDEDNQRLVVEAAPSAMLRQVIDLRAGVQRAH